MQTLAEIDAPLFSERSAAIIERCSLEREQIAAALDRVDLVTVRDVAAALDVVAELLDPSRGRSDGLNHEDRALRVQRQAGEAFRRLIPAWRPFCGSVPTSPPHRRCTDLCLARHGRTEIATAVASASRTTGRLG